MTLKAVIYGFGSFFKGEKNYHDIDLLILHENSSKVSCEYAARCREKFSQKINDAHITLLSMDEEEQLCFILKSGASKIGEVYSSKYNDDIAIAIKEIRKWQNNE